MTYRSTQYKLISATSAEALEERVTQWIRLGYRLYEAPFFARLFSLEQYPSGKDHFFQAMSKSEDGES